MAEQQGELPTPEEAYSPEARLGLQDWCEAIIEQNGGTHYKGDIQVRSAMWRSELPGEEYQTYTLTKMGIGRDISYGLTIFQQESTRLLHVPGLFGATLCDKEWQPLGDDQDYSGQESEMLWHLQTAPVQPIPEVKFQRENVEAAMSELACQYIVSHPAFEDAVIKLRRALQEGKEVQKAEAVVSYLLRHIGEESNEGEPVFYNDLPDFFDDEQVARVLEIIRTFPADALRQM